MDVAGHSLGVGMLGGLVRHLIPRNTPVPVSARELFHPARDGQTEVRIPVYQGESLRADEGFRRILERGEKLARLLETSARENPGPEADAAVQRVRTLLEQGRHVAATPESLQPPEAREHRAQLARALLSLLHGV